MPGPGCLDDCLFNYLEIKDRIHLQNVIQQVFNRTVIQLNHAQACPKFRFSQKQAFELHFVAYYII